MLLRIYGTNLLPNTLYQQGSFLAERVVRNKFEQHFKLDNALWPVQSVARWIDNIRELKGKVNPRVVAANIKLAYNGWPCHKRCGITDSKCILCGQHV